MGEKRRKIAVIGAGSIGGVVAHELCRAGHDVTVLARPGSLTRLARGLRVRRGGSEEISFPRLVTDPRELAGSDLMFLSVKAYDLAGVIADVPRDVFSHAVVVTLMNGVPWWFAAAGTPIPCLDPEGRIEARIPRERVVAGVVGLSAARSAEGVIERRAGELIEVGCADGSQALVPAVADAFGGTSIRIEPSSDIRRAIWSKLMNNASMNPISAVTGATLDRITSSTAGIALASAAMAEVEAVGRALGIVLDQSIEQRIAYSASFGAFRTSMLQDIDAGRRPEIEALVMAVCELGESRGVACHTLRTLERLIRLRLASA